MVFFQDKLIDVKMFTCKNDECHDKISYDTNAVYLPIYNKSFWEPIFLEDIFDINILIEKLLDQLPGPQELSDNDFKVKCLFVIYICTSLLL